MSERTPPPPPTDLPRVSPRRRRLIFVGLAIVLPLVVLVVAAGLTVQVLGWTTFRQASNSMRPGMLLDEYFFVDTRAYKDARRPDYGDIIALSLPADIAGLPRAGQTVTYVKRVVGLPGDGIEVKAGAVSVNGQVLPQEPLGELDAGRPGRNEKALWFRERAPNGATYEIMRYRSVRNPDAAAGGSYVVPQGHYFVMGDNRDDSLDSRYWVLRGGWYLPMANITGQAIYIYWSGFDRLDRVGKALK